jgi:type II restriction enzyme
MACRNSIEIVEDSAEARVTTYDFKPIGAELSEAEIEHYVRFLTNSGLLALFARIKSVADYVTGVEVGMDTNARKNRGGCCGIQAIRPFITQAQRRVPNLDVKHEASFDFLAAQGFALPDMFRGVVWDVAFWTGGAYPRLAVVEVNHYGGSGSKPPAIAREYVARQPALDAAGIGFIWVTDGRGWLDMRNPLREAFDGIHYLVNIQLAKAGLLEWALRRLLRVEVKGEKEYAA